MDKQLQELAKWEKVRKELNNSFDFNDSWKEAIELYRTRMNRKFFSPIQSLINLRTLEGEGFTILLAQCALIESLASFRTGQIFCYKRNPNQPNYVYNNSKNMFIYFLHTSPTFKDNFYQIDRDGNKEIDVPFKALDFYSFVRCGLVHEARTIKPWHINATSKSVKEEKIFIEKEGSKVKVLRTILHYRLLACMNEYLNDLQDPSPDKNYLRRLFGRKLDHLFDISSNPSVFNWWIDN